jgi:large repetitive protein
MSPAGFTGPCTFEYEVIDSNTCIGTGDVTILVSPPLVVSNGEFCTCLPNVPVTGSLVQFVTGGLPPYTFSIVGTPFGGTVFLDPTTGIFTFVPTPGFMGIAFFQFMATDSNHPPCMSNIGTIDIQVPCCIDSTGPRF